MRYAHTQNDASLGKLAISRHRVLYVCVSHRGPTEEAVIVAVAAMVVVAAAAAATAALQ